jgi:hypothetical protein
MLLGIPARPIFKFSAYGVSHPLLIRINSRARSVTVALIVVGKIVDTNLKCAKIVP